MLGNFGVAVPQFKVQDCSCFETFYDDEKYKSFVRSASKNSNIRSRYFAADPSLMEQHLKLTLEQRLNLSFDAGVQLAYEASIKALEGWNPHDIDKIIVATSTCLKAPSIDAHLIKLLGLRSDVKTLCVAMKGCVGGSIALSEAFNEVKANNSTVLVVGVDITSYHILHGNSKDGNVSISRAIETILFGDGAGACIVSNKGYWSIDKIASYSDPEYLDNMEVKFYNDSLTTTLDKNVHKLMAKAARSLVSTIGGSFDRLLMHPGGKTILAEVSKELQLEALSSSYVLSEYGNMSAATIFFVLDHAKDEKTYNRDLIVCFGQGINAMAISVTRV